MPKLIFKNQSNFFYNTLKENVDQYFKQKQLKKTGNWQLFLKTGILISIAVLLYISLLLFSYPPIAGILMAGALGFVLASIGFNVMHDACHGSYSSRKWVNESLGLTLNALGGNSFIWKQKHNIIHHTYPNVDGMDDDIAKSPLIRQCDTQRWVPMHRVQHLYLPLVYAITSFAWTFIMDFVKYLSKKIYTTPIQNMNAKEHFIFWLSKFLYLVFYVFIPVLFVGWKYWLVGFVAMHVVLGFTLAIVFQLAHVVESVEFEAVSDDPKVLETEWAVFQVKTTADFAPGNKIISWFVGGLNYQIEHHLFPKVSHIHYPALSKIVKESCKKFNLQYNQFPTMSAAVASHFRMMKKLGEKPSFA